MSEPPHTAAAQSSIIAAALLDASPDGVLLVRRDGCIAYANPRAEALFGYARNELFGRSIENLVPPGARARHATHRDGFDSAPSEARAMGGALHLRGCRKDGTEFDVDVSLAQVQLGDERFALTTVRDVTDRRAVEAALRRSQAQLAEAQRVAQMGSWERVIDEDETKWSEQTYRMFGVEPGTKATLALFLEHVHPEDRPALMAAFTRTIERGTPVESDYRILRHGEERFMHARAERVVGADERTRIVGTVADVTDRRRAEEERAATAAIVASSPDAIIEIALDGKVRRWAGSAERIFGYTAAEAVGQPFQTLVVPAEMRGEAMRRLDRVVRGGGAEAFEAVRLKKDGSPVDVSVGVGPMLAADGRTVGIAVIARDIGELKKLQRRVVLAERTASLGTLASGVAHELNNPLAVVMGSLEFLGEELPAIERLLAGALEGGEEHFKPALLRTREMLDAVGDARERAARMGEIVRDMRLFSRADASAEGAVDVRQVLDATLKIASAELRQRARVVVSCQDVSARGDESRVGQVLLNLLLNAAQAIPAGHAQDNEIRVTIQQEAQRVLIEVSDTGSGIPVDVRDRIFDPFFTLKAVGAGSGLGLAVCQGIVNSLGGEITFESQVGKGSTFRAWLPANGSSTHEGVAEPRGRVLVVDDDDAIGRLIARILGSEHDVVVETRAKAALGRFEAGERFDLVLCDLMMPEMSGEQLHAALLQIAPTVADAMVFISGGAHSPEAAAFLRRHSNPCLDKPIDTKGLRALARERLATRRAPS